MSRPDTDRLPEAARPLATRLHELADGIGGHVRIMEMCGGHTHAIYRSGLHGLLPGNVEMLHGPGCPVCVLPTGRIDDACSLAADHEVVLCTYGDVARVPGTNGSLLTARARGADVRVVYSPLDALDVAQAETGREVVLCAVGFETTGPPTAVAVLRAQARGLANFSVFSNLVLLEPAVRWLLESEDSRIDAFLGPGHVSTVVGRRGHWYVPADYAKPVVVAGFEALDILEALVMILAQVAEGRCEVENQYRRAVSDEGNPQALAVLERVFEPRATFEWRGMGWIPHSGYKLRPEFAALDAEERFTLAGRRVPDPKACRCGEILRGARKPWECGVFGTACTPEHPVGTCMVSAEGACAAHYLYGRLQIPGRGRRYGGPRVAR